MQKNIVIVVNWRIKIVFCLWLNLFILSGMYIFLVSKNKTSDEWYNCNGYWNHCPKRVGFYLHIIKTSICHDYRHLIIDESRQKQLFIWRKYIETFFEQVRKYMITIYVELVTFGIACEQESKKQRNKVRLQHYDHMIIKGKPSKITILLPYFRCGWNIMIIKND